MSTTAIDAPIDALRGLIDPHQPLFALVDPLAGEPLAATDPASRKAAWRREVFTIRLDERIGIPEHQQPYLVELTGSDDSVLGGTFDMAWAERSAAQRTGLAPYRIGGWIQSVMDPAQVAARIAGLCRLRVHGGPPPRARYLRMADRRVFGLVRDVLGARALAAALGEITAWLWLDDSGRIEKLARGSEGGDTQWSLEGKAWKRIAQGKHIHPLRVRLTALRPKACADFERIESALDRAQAFRLRWPRRFIDERDVGAWALLSLCADGVEHHEAVHAILRDGDPRCPEVDGRQRPFHELLDAALATLARDDERTPE